MSTTTVTKTINGLSHANEVFCQCLARGYTKTDAYREAYPKSKTWKDASAANKASALSKVAAIQARVAAIQAPAIQEIRQNSAGYGLKEAMDEAERALALAERSNQAGAMVAAVQLKAKLNALLVERREVSVTQMDGMTPSEKGFMLEQLQRALAERKSLLAPDQGIEDVEPK